MKILYVANHDQLSSNDDEGSVADALVRSGHEVVKVFEVEDMKALTVKADLCLFHKWHNLQVIKHLPMHKVFWYFDLVECDDPTLARRCEQRRAWMDATLPLVDLGFCTDGDWVTKCNALTRNDKLVWLTQGADQRLVGSTPATASRKNILFTGIANGGAERQSFVTFMRAKYGRYFQHVERGLYGEQLKAAVANSSLVVCPDYPVGNRYWSNRLFVSLGYGGAVLHPKAVGLAKFYESTDHYHAYGDRKELCHLIDHYLSNPGLAQGMAARGLERTIVHHTYLQRCGMLLQMVKERLGVQ